MPASQLRPNPRNWRTHGAAQRDALRGLLAEVGYAGALLARELADGSLELIDGHLRAETTPDAIVPVLVLDVDEADAAKLLASLDPLGAMAGANAELLKSLLDNVETQSQAVQAMFDDLAAQAGALQAAISTEPPADIQIAEMFQIVVDCGSEEQQRALFERLSSEGLNCRVLTL